MRRITELEQASSSS